jgi:hypothetical protein
MVTGCVTDARIYVTSGTTRKSPTKFKRRALAVVHYQPDLPEKKERGSGSSGHPPGAASRTQLRKEIPTALCVPGHAPLERQNIGSVFVRTPAGVSEQGVNCNCVI